MTRRRPATVAVWWHLVDGEPDAATWAVLDDEERLQASRLATSVRREYVEAHALLRRVLGDLGWSSDAAIVREPCPLCRAPHGRPRLAAEGAPEISLTHAAGLVAVAVSSSVVGLDAEPVVGPHVVDELVGSLHPREQLEVHAATAEDRTAAFTRSWVRSEAYLKGLGTGLGRAPGLDYLGADSPEHHPAGWAVLDVDVPPTFRCAVAVESSAVDLVLGRRDDPATPLESLLGPGASAP